MKTSRGITLIEVILSISLLALIGIVFLTAFNNSLYMMKQGRELTKQAFDAKKELEKSIEIVKSKAVDRYDSRFNIKEYQLFGKKVKGILISQPSIGNENIEAFIANEVDFEEKIPAVKSGSVKVNPQGPLYPTGGQALTGTSQMDSTNIEYLFMKLNRWYVSDAGFDANIPDNVTNENEGLFGKRYPLFPKDYHPIENDTTVLKNLERFAGKHIVYSVTPIDRLGRFGLEEESKSVYIMGPPILENMVFHLDPYSLRRNDGTFIEDDVEILQWKDFYIKKKFNPEYSNSNKTKLFFKEEDGKSLKFKETELTLSYNPTINNYFTVFTVFKNTSSVLPNTYNIIKRRANNENGWEIGLYDNKIGFILKQNASDIKKLIQNNNIANDKYIIVAIFSNNKMKLLLYRNNSKEEFKEDYYYTVNNRGNVQLIIGDTKADLNLYEAIIYNAALSEEDIDKVCSYLSQKHNITIN